MKGLERVKGIEPSPQAWEARILPLNHTRTEEGIAESRGRCNCVVWEFSLAKPQVERFHLVRGEAQERMIIGKWN
jgi:hypothetical protein